MCVCVSLKAWHIVCVSSVAYLCMAACVIVCCALTMLCLFLGGFFCLCFTLKTSNNNSPLSDKAGIEAYVFKKIIVHCQITKRKLSLLLSVIYFHFKNRAQ